VSRDPLFTRPFVLVSLANLLQGLSFFLFIHLPRYLTDLGADEVQVGIIVGVTAIASIAVRPFIGPILDTGGRRPVILFGGLLNTVAVALYLTVSSLGPWLYAVRILHGIAEATMFTALFTYGADIVPATRRTEGLALFGVSGLLPIAVGGVIGDLVLHWATFHALFLTAAGFGLAALAMALSLPEPSHDLEPGAERVGFVRSVIRPNLLPIWLITATFSLVLSGYFTFLRTFVDETGVGSVGLFFATYAGTAITLRILFARLPERIGERKVLFPALFALVAGFLVLAGADSSLHLAIAGVLCGTGHGYAFPILYGFTVTRAPAEDRGSVLAFFTALFDVGTLLGGPVLGVVIALFGYSTMYVTAAVILTAGIAVYAAWDRRYDPAFAAG